MLGEEREIRAFRVEGVAERRLPAKPDDRQWYLCHERGNQTGASREIERANSCSCADRQAPDRSRLPG